jgi:hypothetical protein
MVSCGGEIGTVEQPQPQAEGTLRLPLISPAPDGKVYRLVGATFTITGPQTFTITDTSADTVYTTLQAGAYTIQLGDGWRMERTDAPGTAVPAQLLSPNPLPLLVTKDELSMVRFQFKLAGDGAADVGIKVDKGGWLAGTLQFTERENSGYPSPFDDLVGKSVPFLISYESATFTKENYYGKVLRVHTGPVTVQFGGAPSDLLARAAASLNGSTLIFELRADGPTGFITFSNMFFMSHPEAFELELAPSPYFLGAIDSEGYPAVRNFQFNTMAFLRDSNGSDGVRGTASVNGLP